MEHALRGSWNATRHGQVLIDQQRQATPWTPNKDQISKLGDAGRQLVSRLLESYEFSILESALVLEAAVACDRLAEIPARVQAAISKRAWRPTRTSRCG